MRGLSVGNCVVCHVPFPYDPKLVPTTSSYTGRREPICEDCVKELNRVRKGKGVQPIAYQPQAYLVQIAEGM